MQLVIRVDADRSRGLGHLIRCAALAFEWRARGGEVCIAQTGPGVGGTFGLSATHQRIDAEPGSREDASMTQSLATSLDADWLVLDGDQFDSRYIERLGLAGVPILLIDDFGERPCPSVDLIVNPNLGAHAGLYPQRRDSDLLLGTDFVLLRPSFLTWHDWVRPIDGVTRRVLVFLGGSDPDGSTAMVVEALADTTDAWEVDVVVGPYVDLSTTIDDRRIRQHHDVADIASLMTDADLAVVAAGGAMWELLFMQSAVLSFVRNPLQADVVDALARRGAVVDLGSPTTNHPSRLIEELRRLSESRDSRRSMAALGRAVVDGRGALRVVDCMWDRGHANTGGRPR